MCATKYWFLKFTDYNCLCKFYYEEKQMVTIVNSLFHDSVNYM